jgi:hypothetical protein
MEDYIVHETHIKNLDGILASGAILSLNEIEKRGIKAVLPYSADFVDRLDYGSNVYTRLIFDIGKTLTVKSNMDAYLIFRGDLIKKADFFCTEWYGVYQKKGCTKEPSKNLYEIKKKFVFKKYADLIEELFEDEEDFKDIPEVLETEDFKEFSKNVFTRIDDYNNQLTFKHSLPLDDKLVAIVVPDKKLDSYREKYPQYKFVSKWVYN